MRINRSILLTLGIFWCLTIITTSCGRNKVTTKPVETIIPTVSQTDSTLTPTSASPTSGLMTKTVTATKPKPRPTSTPTILPHPTMTAIPTYTPTLPPTLTPTLENCLPSLPTVFHSIIRKGSVLFTQYGVNASPGLWGISAGALEARVVLEPPLLEDMGAFGKLSHDGSKFAWDDLNKQPEELVVDDLKTQQQTRFPWQASWKSVWDWTEDGRVILYVNGEKVLGEGVTREYEYFDTQTRKTEKSVVKLILPGFDFASIDHNPLGGTYEVDPTGSLVLYTALGAKAGQNVILREIKTGRELWKVIDNLYFTPPEWTRDGKWVVLTLRKAIGDDFIKIFRLSRDGKQLEELTHKPLAKGDYILRDLRVSPNGRYIYYADWMTVSEGSAHILDLEDSSIREICTPGYTPIGGVQWFPEGDQLIYVVRQGGYDNIDEPNKQELRILDIPTWTSQTIYAGEDENIRIWIIGWSPLTFP